LYIPGWREGLFEDYERLIQIVVCDRSEQVPENNKLLRCFQYMSAERVSMGDYCWNGDCTNCQVWYVGEDGDTRSALACRMYVRSGLVITSLSEALKSDLMGRIDQDVGLKTKA
jgi:hypothetical protein